MKKRILSILLVLTIAFAALPGVALAASSADVEAAVNDTAEYIYKTVKNPQVGSIGGEWAVLGLARSGCSVPDEYYQDYYATLENYVKACDGVLHKKKYTEYSRIIVALSAIGKDARNVAGYDLTYALGDYDKTIWQGLNGPIWALIALDSRNYPVPTNKEAKTQASRQMYVDRILECQLPDGGWSLFGGTAAATSGDGVSDPDITGMALQALAKYQNQTAVKKACDEALECMSKKQGTGGGFSSWGTANSESCVQIIVALCELGISLDDPRFVKNGHTLVDNLMTFYLKGKGFLHTLDGSGSNQMATEQAFYALVSLMRANKGKNSLYRMSDAISIGEGESGGPKKGEGLPGKHADIKSMPIKAPGTTFEDTVFSPNVAAIEALAVRGIINGKGGGLFEPEGDMTRAEFATIVTRGLGLEEDDTGAFRDVTPDKWYAGYVGTAHKYGVVNGVGDNRFDPEGTITRQEAATLVARVAKLCGMDTEYDAAAARDVLSQFGDYVTVASWAQSSMAFCYGKGIMDNSALNIEPNVAILRCEIAQMLFNMLAAANLL